MSEIQAALDQVDALDALFAAGVARLVPEQRATLATFAGAFAGSPLGDTVQTAADAIAAGDLSAHHLVALAAARASVMGAVADALLAESDVVLAPTVACAKATHNAAHRPPLEAVKQWLVEVALGGFRQLDARAIAPILPTLTTLQQTAPLARIAALVTGLVHELLEHAPTSALVQIPQRRWADLWSLALLGTVVPPDVVATTDVSGRLFVLGADLRQHDHFVSVVIHGVLEDADGSRRFTRSTYSSWKVDAIAGAEVWNLLRPRAPELFEALVTPAVLSVAQATLSSTGELTLGAVTGAEPYDPFTLQLGGVLLSVPAPRDRHPIHLAIPALDATDPLDASRSAALSGLSEAALDATSVLGLRRWDGGWSFQPLIVKRGKKVIGAAASLVVAAKSKGDARATLTERASMLLRS